jgi:predicted Zn-dependent protease
VHAPTALHLEDAHATDAVLALLTFVLGAVGLALIAADATQAGIACGLAGMASGMWGQMISRTTSERYLDVIGLVAAGLAVAIGSIAG